MAVAMSRIDSRFSQAKEQGRGAFVAYVCACDPDFETSLDVCRTLLDSKVDVLELGVPFSDPLADGLTNQLAAERALASGATQEDVFGLVRELRKVESEVPIVFYAYYNLMFSNGLDGYIKTAKEAGVDGLLVLDLPPEEAGEYMSSCKKHGMQTVFLIAPTTPSKRIEYIAQMATGFVYYVSRTGVTGIREDLAPDLKERVALIRKATDKPLVVGFGVSKREQVRSVCELADGVVVGSAIVNTIKENLGDTRAITFGMSGLLAELTLGVAPER